MILLALKRIILLGIALLVFNSCKKSQELVGGTIRFSGQVSVDGCGWVIDLENGPVHPVNLDSIYRKDNLKIELNYKELKTNFDCGIGSSLKEIEITTLNPV
jgi:hypothetical protein